MELRFVGQLEYFHGGSATTQTRTHNDANETLTVSNWQNPSYDDAGNMTSMPDPVDPATDSLDLKYDAWNRLVEVKRDSTVLAEYEYDGLHRSIVRTLDPGTGNEKEYHSYYSLAGQELEVREGTSSNPVEQFVWHPHYVDALAIFYSDTDGNGSMDSSSDVFYATQDANLNVTALVDVNNDVVERYDYMPYGELLVRDADFSDDADNLSDYDNAYTYTGRRFDIETGLYYYRARYYSPNVGAFVSRDPIGFGGRDANLTRYVKNSPTNFVDPSGMIVKSPAIGSYQQLRTHLGNLAKQSITFQGFINSARSSLGGYNTAGRFVYSKKHGWVDIKHLLSSYKYTGGGRHDPLGYNGPLASGAVLSAGCAVEKQQALKGDESQWGVEDLPSNKLGTELSRYWHFTAEGFANDLFGLLGP